MVVKELSPVEAAANRRNTRRALAVAAWGLIVLAVFGGNPSHTSKLSKYVPVPKSMRRQEEVGALFHGKDVMAMQPDGHCRGKKAGGSCCGERFQGSFILPLLPHTELTWPRWFRGLVYLLGLGWVFMGVSILCDAFMNGIEAITSQTYIKKVPIYDRDGKLAKDSKGNDLYSSVEAESWNASVANLTLMALGSSTPEIMLNVIETICSGFFSGDLGPGTIVGSAAFNLFVITGLCMMALPPGETKSIEKYSVFMLTSAHSVIAYAWVVIIVTINTKDVVDLWEALVTFAFMPWMVCWVYAADKEWFRKDNRIFIDDEEGQAALENEAGPTKPGDPANPESTEGSTPVPEGPNAPAAVAPTADAPTRVVSNERQRRASAAYHSSYDEMVGGDHHMKRDENGRPIKTLKPKANPTVAQRKREALRSMTAPQTAAHHQFETMTTHSRVLEGIPEDNITRIHFQTPKVSVLENVGNASIPVVRTGPSDQPSKVHYVTKEGSAKPGADYAETSGVLTFAAGETYQEIQVGIVDDSTQWNAEKDFTVTLSFDGVEQGGGHECKLGPISVVTVGIIDVDNPGEFCFTESAYVCLSTDSKVAMSIERRSGVTGVATVTVLPVAASAEAGKHFVGEEVVVTFQQDQAAALVQINLKHDGWEDADPATAKTLRFFAELVKPTPEEGAKVISPNRAEVIIRWNEDSPGAEEAEEPSWGMQFKLALAIENPEEASKTDLCVHYATIFWKLFAAIIPPAELKIMGRETNGWATFVTAILMIGFVTTIINDLASIFGCIVGLEDSITAITLVALGTSLPDTIASMMSARADTNADNSIGNITGSNSVNVFLGIGLPWSIAALYWEVAEPSDAWRERYADWLLTDIGQKYADTGGFVVLGGDLAFYTMIFVILACSTIGLLTFRRFAFGYELGGGSVMSKVHGYLCISFWFIYVIVSIVKVYAPEGTFIDLGR
uniref:Calx-beta domain-containing protein n=2 Tax=Hemiselmis andersenii TaxID=464988 RepID=A0A6U4NQ54_HEMAN|mmetsp:Transcript_19916/g.45865  ORF Transcript_19916/g.45865 Transcript_19916/m.45865 type:complete len:959 (+) Transcript_19916:236-3112(+)